MNDDYYGVKRMHENRCWNHYNASVLVDSVTQHGNWNIGYIDASLVLIDMIHAYHCKKFGVIFPPILAYFCPK